ncbi:MAG: tRNA (N6-isopentenyl adenosine(37)-C2)-methylthiotransferase MiaB [Dehalococcoidia bacterium]|nr:tRNA (N6-isopentenyl adenosine(37)-C2)-methylthiotransferase MiaB [Dehalococcoidia bacterium]
MPRYHLWTIGCQMNKAESQRIAGMLTAAGYEEDPNLNTADLVILNTCVVRQSAEDRIVGTLGLLEGAKRERQDLRIVVTGCFTARDRTQLHKRFPHVDLFFDAGAYDQFADWLTANPLPTPPSPPAKPFFSMVESSCARALQLDGSAGVSTYVPIIQGCNNFCTYCIVPYTRGREISRPLDEIEAEVRELVSLGSKEVVLLGQNVDSYGHDLQGTPDLSDLLVRLEAISGLLRIRFLTNHPKDLSRKLIRTMAELDKVCEHLDLALQSGDNDILHKMGRGYTVEHYSDLVREIRAAMPGISLSADLIVGFPGETDEQFENSYRALEQFRFDVVHVASYSSRPGTVATRKFEDSVQADVKKLRLQRVEKLQEEIATEINAGYVGNREAVLIQGTRRGKWFGRTRTDKLVFVESDKDMSDQLVYVTIAKASPWALQGSLD